jgi:hypothetical protein
VNNNIVVCKCKNNNIVVCKCKNRDIPTNIDSRRNIGHKLVIWVKRNRIRSLIFFFAGVMFTNLNTFFLCHWCFKTQVTHTQNNWTDISNLLWTSCQFD